MLAGQKLASETAETRPLIETPRIREQLERLLAHPLFANSKRYPALLAYAVEQTLLGNAGELKERSIGVEVFRLCINQHACAHDVRMGEEEYSFSKPYLPVSG